MEVLTKAEEQVMRALWSIERGFVKDVLDALPSPKQGESAPAYTTISTIIRILEQKGFVDHEAFGRSHRYFPKVTKEEYSARSVRRVVTDYFGGSPQGLLSHFIEKEDLSMEDLDALLKVIRERKQQR
jgi:predicted transcriptional regulator